MTKFEEGVSVGIHNFMSAFGCQSAGLIADKYVRKKAIYLSALFLLVQSQVLQGLGNVASPILISELVPADKRGAWVACTCVMTNLGIFLGYLCGYLFNLNNNKNNWRYTIRIG